MDKPLYHTDSIFAGKAKPGEICPGVTWEDHADSIARFLSHDDPEPNLPVLRYIVLSDLIDGDPDEVKDYYDKAERSS